MSRSSTPLATTRSKMERASRDTKKKSPLPHDDQAPRREGIFVLGEQDQAVVFDAALRQDWDSITRIYEATYCTLYSWRRSFSEPHSMTGPKGRFSGWST